ncbi:MAG: IclR family transcriptional regulator C-terminal domain-containing protein [Burkholderiaceae bacterium]
MTEPSKTTRRPRSLVQRQKVQARMTASSEDADSAIGVRAFERGLDVIRAFSSQQRAMTITEVAAQTGQSRASARRLLGSLVRLRYAATDGQTYWLTPAVLELGYAYLSSNLVWDRVQPYMQQVVAELNESCSLGVLDLPAVVYVARVPARRIVMTVSINIGTKIPAAVSSMGRLLLAYQPRSVVESYLDEHPLQKFTPHTVVDRERFFEILDQARTDGWLLIDEEFEEGLRSIAVPIRDRSGAVVAAINVGAPTSRATREQMISRFLPVIKEAATRANHSLSLG